MTFDKDSHMKANICEDDEESDISITDNEGSLNSSHGNFSDVEEYSSMDESADYESVPINPLKEDSKTLIYPVVG